MITPLLILLQLAPAAAPSDLAIPTQPGAAAPLVQLAALRDEMSETFKLLQETRSSLRSTAKRPPSMPQIPGVQQMLDGMDAYVDYYLNYHQAQDAVVGAIEHAFYIDTPSCGATTEHVVLGMGGTYTAGQTYLIGTLPDVNGQATVIGSSGGVATAQPLVLLPMALPGNAQGGAPAFNHPVHYYSATLTDGSRHSGLAVQLDSGGQSFLVLYPDAVIGTSVFTPNDLSLLRWVLLEYPSVLAGVVFDSILVPFSPPGLTSDDDNGVSQDVAAAIVCCQKAVQQWKKEMTDLAFYLQAWEKQIANTYEPAYEQLTNDIKSELGSHGVDVVMNDSFILDTAGMGMDAFQAKVDEFTARKDELDQAKKNEETNLKNFRTNGTNAANARLRTKVLACLASWEEATAIADQIVARAIQLVY